MYRCLKFTRERVTYNVIVRKHANINYLLKLMTKLFQFEQVGLMLAGMGRASINVFRMVHKEFLYRSHIVFFFIEISNFQILVFLELQSCHFTF